MRVSVPLFLAFNLTLSIAPIAHAAEFCSMAKTALHKNHAMLAMHHQLAASKERIFQSQNINGPKLELLADLSAYNSQGNAGFQKNANIAIGFSQTLYDSGQASALAAQARGNEKLLKLEMSAGDQQIIADVAALYVQHLQNMQLLALHRRNIANTNAQYKISLEKFNASQATQQELMLVKSRLRQAMSQMLRAKAQVVLTRVKLLGLSSQSATGSDGEFLVKLLNRIPKSRDLALATAQQNSIFIDQSDVAIDIAHAAVKAQRASLGPQLQLSAKLGAGTMGSSRGFAGQVGLSFSLPLYSSGVLQSKVREAKAKLASARAKHAYAVELSKQNVAITYEISNNIKQSINMLPEAIKAERLAIRSLELSLASHIIPVTEILLAKASLFELRKSLINLKFEHYLASLSLLNGVGHLKSIHAMQQIGLCG